MKKKNIYNHHHHRNNNIGIEILQGVILCHRRRRVHNHHLWPFISAVAACILFFFAVLSFLSPPIHNHHFRHSRLKYEEVGSNDRNPTAFLVPPSISEVDVGRNLWWSSQSQFYTGCSEKSPNFVEAKKKTNPHRFLLIATSGGLNQQRTGITDAVVAAYILNATLVVPKLDQTSYWKDQSNFSEIFDVDWFISYLSKDVKIIKELPTIGGKDVSPYRTRVPRKCNQGCYQSRMVPLLNKKKAVMLTKFDYRLSNRLATNLQKLRCRANYHALKFTDPIVEMGKVLVERMRKKSKHFIALHLRFESDMLAFSGCYYGGGDKERVELRQIRRRWKTLHKRNPDRERRQGEVYGGEDTLAPLKALFPNIHSKDTIATKEEMAPFLSYSARMAALDFIVCDESDVFVTNNNGNMAKMLAGRRRYFGHKPTIRPNAKKLWRLFVDRNNMTWEEFANTTRGYQVGFMGQPNEVKPGTGEFHENPMACICEKSEAMSKSIMIQSNHFPESDETNYVTDEEHDGFDDEEVENENRTRIPKLAPKDGTVLSHIAIPGASELDEIFSD
nr:O-fucosyltransferase 6-like [Tanacetum cinerariifolium]